MTNSKPKRSKWKQILLATAVLLIIAAGVSLVWLYGTIAPTSGEFAVAGLANQVTIRFDPYERPFVRAETLADVLFAEGWLHAHHRLWQMEMFRRAGKGRLAELLGSSMLESDHQLWRMGVPQLGMQLERNASDEMREYVDAYVAGVNAAINSGESTTPEFLLLQMTAEPWKPDDVYALGALMAFQSGNNSGNELLRLALIDELGEEQSKIFLPNDGQQADFPYVLAGISSGAARPLPPSPSPRRGERGAEIGDASPHSRERGAEIGDAAPRRRERGGVSGDASPRNWASGVGTSLIGVLSRLQTLDPMHNPLMPRFGFGSNGWVVAPEKSATGKALFAFDSHDAFGLPNLFYEVHLFFDGCRQIHGWSVAGLPGVINGYNEQVAWGFTNIGDTQDLFLETRSDSDPLQFKDGDDWYTAETETVEIPVSGRDEPELLTIVRTRNGPLLSDDPPISLRWTVQDLDGRGIDSILKYNLAQSCQEFAEALDELAAPSLNATFADVDGNIGFRTAGLIPIRGDGEGLVPLDGSTAENRWQGYVPMEELPEAFNPDTGFLAAANARVNAEGDGPLISADNAPGYRIRRIQQVLARKDDFTADEMRALQVDWFDTQAALLLPTMIKSVDRKALPELEQLALAELEQWRPDPIAVPDQAAPILFQAWYRHLAIEVFKPALSADLFGHLFRNNYPLNHALDRLIIAKTESDWWQGDRAAMITAAFSAAVAEIAAAQGTEISAWRLDRMHRIRLDHELGKAVPALGWLLNARPAPWGGGTSTVGRARYRYDRAYDATAGATVRVVGEMTESGPVMSAVIPGGQSGHPLSSHYTDQFPVWLEGKVVPIATDFDEVKAAEVQTLLPKKP